MKNLRPMSDVYDDIALMELEFKEMGITLFEKKNVNEKFNS